MTPQFIIEKLFVPVNAERVQKAKALAQRQRLDWQKVLAAMTNAQRLEVEQAENSVPVYEDDPGPVVKPLPVESVSPNQFVDAFTHKPLIDPDVVKDA